VLGAQPEAAHQQAAPRQAAPRQAAPRQAAHQQAAHQQAAAAVARPLCARARGRRRAPGLAVVPAWTVHQTPTGLPRRCRGYHDTVTAARSRRGHDDTITDEHDHDQHSADHGHAQSRPSPNPVERDHDRHGGNFRSPRSHAHGLHQTYQPRSSPVSGHECVFSPSGRQTGRWGSRGDRGVVLQWRGNA